MALSLLLLPLAAVQGVNAWGSLGHATIAYIAQNYVTDEVATWYVCLFFFFFCRITPSFPSTPIKGTITYLIRTDITFPHKPGPRVFSMMTRIPIWPTLPHGRMTTGRLPPVLGPRPFISSMLRTTRPLAVTSTMTETAAPPAAPSLLSSTTPRGLVMAVSRRPTPPRL